MKKEVPDLNKAIATLLYDQYDCPDVFEDMDTEESLIDETILVLAYQNEDVCPFKKYDCIGRCDNNMIGCVDGLYIGCDLSHQDIWRNFIFID